MFRSPFIRICKNIWSIMLTFRIHLLLFSYALFFIWICKHICSVVITFNIYLLLFFICFQHWLYGFVNIVVQYFLLLACIYCYVLMSSLVFIWIFKQICSIIITFSILDGRRELAAMGRMDVSRWRPAPWQAGVGELDGKTHLVQVGNKRD